MRRVYRHTLPGVRTALNEWRNLAERIPDAELRSQAIASIDTKKFHCQGGSVYACANPAQKDVLLALIVAFQTISDYLDNLCDRSTSLDPEDFRRLHQAMLDAVTPSAELADYYAFRDEKEDGGYLTALVETCRSCISRLPSYPLVEEKIHYLVSLYCDLQVYKHIRKDLREEALMTWWDHHKTNYPEIYWNEFAAATGSTLGMFMLFLAASDPALKPEEGETILDAYFPYVTGLHILLDYLIDQEEDRIGGDLNFCFYYQNRTETVERIAAIVMEARKAVTRLPAPQFHRMIIEGLLALYLSDPKVREQPEVRRISAKLMHKSPLTRLFFLANSIWIRIDFRNKH
nr:tetraprenyl-beta-curcumene synthase family protein [Gorillibacterium massiliense]